MDNLDWATEVGIGNEVGPKKTACSGIGTGMRQRHCIDAARAGQENETADFIRPTRQFKSKPRNLDKRS